MIEKQMITQEEEYHGSKIVYKYKITQKGKNLLENILQPYEELFPRNRSETHERKNKDLESMLSESVYSYL